MSDLGAPTDQPPDEEPRFTAHLAVAYELEDGIAKHREVLAGEGIYSECFAIVYRAMANGYQFNEGAETYLGRVAFGYVKPQ